MNNLMWLIVMALLPITVSAHGGHGNSENALSHALLHSELLPFIALALMATLCSIGLIRNALQRKKSTVALHR